MSQSLLLLFVCLLAAAVAYTPIASITIDRDSSGTIHVNAANELDLFYGQGRAMAEDRLWQLDFNTRAAKGRLAEILGAAGLTNDVTMRTFGLWNASQEAVKVLANDVIAPLDAFISGINDYIRESHPLPLEFTVLGYTPSLFTVADVILISKFMSTQLAGNMNAELDRYKWEHGPLKLTRDQIDSLFPKYEPIFPTTMQYEDVARMRFTGKFDAIPAPRFAKRSARNAFNFNSDDSTFNPNNKREEKEEESPITKMSIDEYLSAEGPQKWTKHGFGHITAASNAWVIGGARTASKLPLLMNDPHLTMSLPSIWSLMSLKCPTINVTGATISGAPGITIGRNEKITWGVTNVRADVQDLYILQLSSDNKTYIHRGTEYDFVIRMEQIVVKGGQTINLPVRETLYGPVLSDAINMYGNTVALQWTALNVIEDGSLGAFIKINKAKNFQEFRDALKKHYVGPVQNFFYADTDGNIGYQLPGKIPVRRSSDGQYAVKGAGLNDWIGFIKFEELPFIYNPTRGWIANGNNKVAPNTYPYVILNDRDWELHYRVSRIEELIKERRDHSVATQIAMQTDTVTYSWNDLRTIVFLLPNSRLDRNGTLWKNTLLGWDGNCSVDDVRPTVYEFWIYELGRMGNFSGYAHVYGTYYVYSSIIKSFGRLLPFAADAFQRTVDTLLTRYNGTIPKWGDVNTGVFEHPVLGATPYAPLVSRSVRRAGDYTTINVATPNINSELGLKQYSQDVPNPFVKVGHGPSYRQIVDLSGKNMETKSVYVLPGGQSGIPTNPHYADLLPLWVANKYIPFRMNNYTLESREVYP